MEVGLIPDLVARLGYDCATVYNFLVPNGYDCATDLVVDLGEPPATCAPLPTCSLADFCTTTCGIEHCAPAALSGDGVALDEGAAGVVLHVQLSNSSAARAFFHSAGEGAALELQVRAGSAMLRIEPATLSFAAVATSRPLHLSFPGDSAYLGDQQVELTFAAAALAPEGEAASNAPLSTDS